ncbi:membrane-bound dehydrogenase domain protein : Probable L-sorbosone dehydrogenase OS=Planctomyces maris DSM 8797 GN=PM8797T_24331 PE=4 SV=1 [Gemmataceae bacterium]|nr:membrane-bound dehydrogenase domain protein : Probable L-sorbosone dehydrogenase OS=Planctomyces maris DSM 8797 GN=PM8797T_24331 PE=4 SV=1 [Gemmataceae bacterium]VTT97436.1 membrane-bound dehydrogenase domain protein : Probable L-sorbosone dehydrogenase OS=Planctomyces maris DSM 8797 GN=PM8797T_24331 PE=4 SV=1 [Gemmataceae bacterium]
MRHTLPALLLVLLPSAAFAQRDAKTPDPDPELERKTFIVAPGFEVNLWASDPLLAKPIQMNFDPQGRLWIASSEIYPQIKPGEKANDKVLVLEDTDNDGKADKTTVFADGLLIPTGVLPGDGGVYVANSTELVHLSASKPGEKADKKRVVLSGFGTEDTHHIIHTFRWGPDSHLYFNQSIYIHSHVETPHGVKRLNAGGIWRFNPDTTRLDVFARGWVNAWGHAFDKYGQSIVTDGAGGEGINHAIPGGYYLTSQGPHVQRVLHGLNPGSPKFCGVEIISGRHFPDDWQGDCITNDFRGHRVCRFKLKDDGSTFASRELTEVIKSNHPAFRPIDVKMGPDGALYIADWYNPIIQHGEVDFRDPRRDKTHGRIWRVTAKGRDLVKKPKLEGATAAELLEQLKAPEQWTRDQAKRVLKEMGREKVLPELAKWLSGGRTETEQLEAAWLLAGFGAADALPTQLLQAKDPAVRAAAIRLKSQDPAGFSLPTVLWNLTTDENPRVRLEAVRASVTWRDPTSVTQALSALDKPMDKVLDYALWLTVRELEPYWMPEFKEGKLTFGGDAKKLAFALNAVGNKDTVKPVLALIDGGKVPKANAHGLYLLLTQIGGPDELAKVLTYAAAKDTAAPQRVEAVKAVEDAIRGRKVAPPKDASALAGLLADGDARAFALRTAGLWKLAAHRPTVQAAATAKDAPPQVRLAALEAVALYGDADARKFLEGLAGTADQPEAQRLALIALAGLDMPAAAAKAAEFLTTAKAEPELADLYAAFLSRKAGVPALAKALAGKKLNADVAKLGLQAVRSSTLTVPELVDALTKAGDLGAVRKPPTPDEVKALVADLDKADPARGEIIFRRKELQCLACHAVGGAGGQVGPDFTSIGASAQRDYLVESLLLPNKAVKEGYNAIRVVTLDDKVYLGIKVREVNGQLVLRTPEDKEVTIPVKDIAERADTKSIMPEGLTDSLTKQEFADLARFLSELGKVGGAYAPNKARLVRRWQVIDASGENLNLFRRVRVSAAAEPDAAFAWSPAYSLVSGDLPVAALPKFSVWANTADQSVVRFALDVTTAGPAKLKFNSVNGLSVFVGPSPVEAKPETVLDLKAGVQTVTLVIDRSKRTEDLRVELDDAPGSPARVAVVGGK